MVCMELSSKTAKSAVPLQGTQGGRRKYEPCAAGDPRHGGLVLRKGPFQSAQLPGHPAACLSGEKKGRSKHFVKSKTLHNVKTKPT